MECNLDLINLLDTSRLLFCVLITLLLIFSTNLYYEYTFAYSFLAKRYSQLFSDSRGKILYD